jgi:hypothetical protein
MKRAARLRSTFVVFGTTAWLLVGAAPSAAGQEPESDRQRLLERIAELERRVDERPAAAESSGVARAPDAAPDDQSAAAAQQGAGATQELDLQRLLDRIEELERRLSELETLAVLSEPETRVRRIEVWVDESGIEHDEQVPGSRRVVTYERERVYRRQFVNEKIEEALAAESESRVTVGVDAAFVTQFTGQASGDSSLANGAAYGLASADVFFAAPIAQYTLFFADIVGLSGSPPDTEIPTLSLINGYTARLGEQNKLNLREAWVRTELFSQTLALSAGRLDLTNYFDLNNVANDETTQFISDTLVNNPSLGLSSNGVGVAGVFDPKVGVSLKAGFQQSNPDAANLSESIYSLVEVGYVGTPIPTGEGNYRVWFRSDNSSGSQATAIGVSLDQKLTPAATLFARFGSAEADVDRDAFYSLGVGFANGLVLNRWDTWGVGYAHSDLDAGDREHVAEIYYSFGLSERLRLAAHFQYFKVLPASTADPEFSYFAPGVRFQAGF